MNAKNKLFTGSGRPAAAAEESVMMGEFSLVDSAIDDATSVDSDPAALVEDALLGELFFQQLEAQCQVLIMTTLFQLVCDILCTHSAMQLHAAARQLSCLIQCMHFDK